MVGIVDVPPVGVDVVGQLVNRAPHEHAVHVGEVDMRGYGRAYPLGARQVVVAVTHVSDNPLYTRLNDSLSVGCGEVRRLSDEETELVIDVGELIWEPIDA